MFLLFRTGPTDTDWARNVPPYTKTHVKPRTNRVARYFLGPTPNKHEQLFWFAGRGPEFLVFLFRLLFLLNAIYLGMVVAIVSPRLFAHDATLSAGCACAPSSCPVLFTLTLTLSPPPPPLPSASIVSHRFVHACRRRLGVFGTVTAFDCVRVPIPVPVAVLVPTTHVVCAGCFSGFSCRCRQRCGCWSW